MLLDLQPKNIGGTVLLVLPAAVGGAALGFEPTLGDLVLIPLVLFTALFEVGAVLGFAVAFAAVSLRARRDGKAPGSRSGRIGLYLLGALLGGALNLLVALLLSGATS